jgi:hypothetical protein
MRLNLLKIVMLAIVIAAPAAARAQSQAPGKFPPETRNAALRYWSAFADIQDPPADKLTQDLLEKVAAGDAPWDEAKLGAILDQNETAILAMQRAAKLPECDWGLEYSRGPRTSIAYVPRSRVLARLNTLYGMRQMAKGDPQAAVETWLDGIRFSRHVAQNGTLIFQLVGKMAMLSNFRALTSAAESHQLSDAQRAQVLAAVQALPADGFDWGQALALEEATLEIGVQQIAQSENPAASFGELMGHAAPSNFTVPAAKDIAEERALFAEAEAAMHLPPAQAHDRIAAIQARIPALHTYFRETTPTLTKVNDARAELAAARQKLLQTLGGS